MDCFMSMWLIKAMQCTSFIQGLTIEFEKKMEKLFYYIVETKRTRRLPGLKSESESDSESEAIFHL